jgi:hypothetical protein
VFCAEVREIFTFINNQLACSFLCSYIFLSLPPSFILSLSLYLTCEQCNKIYCYNCKQLDMCSQCNRMICGDCRPVPYCEEVRETLCIAFMNMQQAYSLLPSNVSIYYFHTLTFLFLKSSLPLTFEQCTEMYCDACMSIDFVF